MNNIKKFFVITSVFAGFFFIPFNSMRISNAVMEALFMTQEYARDHILLCLLPAFFIAGAIGNFISQGAVIKFLGAKANKFVSYGVASVSGSILAVCSCTVLPLFGGIYKRGAGLGPAISFLYSGPAINVLAIIMTARILGLELGIARAISAVIFSIVIGIMMHFIFIKEENARNKELEMMIPEDENSSGRKLWQTALNIAAMIGILVFVNWGKDESMRFWNVIYNFKYHITAVFAVLLAVSFILWFRKDEMKSWVKTSFEFSLQIMPLLFAGVLIAGFLLGRPGHEGIIPSQWISCLSEATAFFLICSLQSREHSCTSQRLRKFRFCRD